MTETWRERARDVAHRRRAFWIWSPVFTGVGALAIAGGLMADQAWLRWAGILCGGAMALWGFVYGTAIYIRTVDEQERDANLWSCYAGMCAYLLLFTLQFGAEVLGRPVPHADLGVFLIVMTVVLGVFAWKRFR
ncbi:hypothetical protein [Sphingomonas sp.]|jgi:hypothetical protein|uniref:hypothetical protein n=1 Tax=Sphingomonas sp. TaxID=28214 RepID=UPI002D7E576F|nr:hypothetical protein [Sphingomonas sp.]HEU0044047.1 hypothetical protein [Sphingomonas sp.]